jgi:hypothetical protein
VHDVHRAAGHLAHGHRSLRRRPLGGHRPGLGEVARMGPALLPQHLAAAVHDGDVLAVQQRQAAEAGCSAQRVEVAGDGAVEAPERQEDLHRGVAQPGQLLEGVDLARRGVHQDRVEEEVAAGVGFPVGGVAGDGVGHDLAPVGMAHVADRRDAPGQGGGGAAGEVVGPVPGVGTGAGGGEVHVAVDAAGHDGAPVGVDLAVAGHRPAELHDAATVDADVGDGDRPGGHHRPSAHDQVHGADRSSRWRARRAWCRVPGGVSDRSCGTGGW